jgi:hypothetical protein
VRNRTPRALRGESKRCQQRPLHPSPVSSGEPPEYLRQLSPQLYQQEVSRIAARFDEAVQLAEHTFTEELSKLVSHLTERLSGSDDGKPKVFRDSAIENLSEFFARFRHLNIRSDQQLDNLVAQARRVVRGVERPRRNILRR